MEKLEKNEMLNGKSKACLLFEYLVWLRSVKCACERAVFAYKKAIMIAYNDNKTADLYYKDGFEVLSDFVVTLHRCIADLPPEVQKMARERVARGDWLGGAQDGNR